MNTIVPGPSEGITVLVLAAGKGARFTASGGTVHKLQALLNGKAVMQHVLDTVAQAGLSCHQVLPAGGATAGMGDSIAYGVAATAKALGWLVLPADMPRVQASTLQQLAQALQASHAWDAVVPSWQGQSGHPVAFSARCLQALLALHGEQGARSVLQALRSQGKVKTLEVDDPGIVQDVDTLDDLRRMALAPTKPCLL